MWLSSADSFLQLINTVNLGGCSLLPVKSLALRYRWPFGIWCLSQALEHPLGFDLREDFQSPGWRDRVATTAA